MTLTNHLMTGAMIALVAKQPFLAIPLAFMSHFALDALPHYGDPGHGESEYEARRRVWAVRVIDFAIGGMFFYYLIDQQMYFVAFCALVAFIPDMVWIHRYIRQRYWGDVGLRNRFSRFHEHIQRESQWGIVVEVVFGVMMVFFLSKLMV